MIAHEKILRAFSKKTNHDFFFQKINHDLCFDRLRKLLDQEKFKF